LKSEGGKHSRLVYLGRLRKKVVLSGAVVTKKENQPGGLEKVKFRKEKESGGDGKKCAHAIQVNRK